MRKLWWVIPALLFTVLGTSKAHADTITIFNVSGGVASNFTGGSLGSCASNADCPYSGTVTIDVTTGTVTGVDISFPGLAAFGTIQSQGSLPTGVWSLTVSNSSGDTASFDISTASLVDFTGGGMELLSVTEGASALYFGSVDATLTPAPEPPTLAMLLIGLGAVFVGRKRFASGTDATA